MYCSARIAVALLAALSAASLLCAEEPAAELLQREFAKFDQVAIVHLDSVRSNYKRYRAQVADTSKELMRLEQPMRDSSPYHGSLEEIRELQKSLPDAERRKIDQSIELRTEIRAKADRLKQQHTHLSITAMRDIDQQIAEYCDENNIRLVLNYYNERNTYDIWFCGLSKLDPPQNKELPTVFQRDRDITDAIIDRLNAKQPAED